MKKLLLALGTVVLLGACASTSEINTARGSNSARLSAAELKQHNQQRVNEVSEAQAQSAKIQSYADSVKTGVEAVKSIMSIFGR